MLFRSSYLFLGLGFLLYGATASIQAQAPVAGEPVIEPGHTYVPPKVLTRQPVSYPEMAHLNRVEGVARVKFTVDETGHVESVFADKSSGSVMLDQVVLDPRLKEWTFQPATLDGKPISAALYQEFEFRLDPAEERAIALRRLALPYGIPDPPYPPQAAARGLKGKTTLAVFWQKENGLVDKIYLIKSSDSGLLDSSALRFAYEHWRMDPALATTERYVKTVEFSGP